MLRTNRILLVAAMLTAASAAGSFGFAQQGPSGSQERPGGSGMMQGGGGMMQGGGGMMGGGMMDGMMGGGMQGMDCHSMMEGQGGSASGSADDRSKEMMERCRSMMGQTPSIGSSNPPAAPAEPEKKE